MEAYLTGASGDQLLEGLIVKAPSSAQYVQTNRFVQYFPESGNTFDSLSSKVIRFRLADHGFFEGPSAKLRFTPSTSRAT